MLMMAFSGLLAARKNKFAKLWIIGSMIFHARNSMSIFCATDLEKAVCCGIIGLEALWMCFFKNRELKMPKMFGGIIHDMSRNAIFYYLIHMCYYVLIGSTQG